MPILGAGLAKAIVVGAIAVGGLNAGYKATFPNSPMNPTQRYIQAVEQHGVQSKAAREARLQALRRGIDVDNTLRQARRPKLVAPPQPSRLSRLLGRAFKRLPIRLR